MIAETGFWRMTDSWVIYPREGGDDILIALWLVWRPRLTVVR